MCFVSTGKASSAKLWWVLIFPSLLADPLSAHTCFFSSTWDSQGHFPLLSLLRSVRKHIYPSAGLPTRLETNSAALHWASSRLPAAAADRWRSWHKVVVCSSKFLVVQPFLARSCSTRFCLNPYFSPEVRVPLLCPGHCAAVKSPAPCKPQWKLSWP